MKTHVCVCVYIIHAIDIKYTIDTIDTIYISKVANHSSIHFFSKHVLSAYCLS